MLLEDVIPIECLGGFETKADLCRLSPHEDEAIRAFLESSEDA